MISYLIASCLMTGAMLYETTGRIDAILRAGRVSRIEVRRTTRRADGEHNGCEICPMSIPWMERPR